MGRPPSFSSPEDLGRQCDDYLNWVEANPLYEAKLVSFQGVSTIEQLPKMRAMTIDGLCVYVGISVDTWANYRKKPNFLAVVTRVEAIMRTQKFTGAAAELLNPSIIAYDLGLKRKADEAAEVVSETESDQFVEQMNAATMGAWNEAN